MHNLSRAIPKQTFPFISSSTESRGVPGVPELKAYKFLCCALKNTIYTSPQFQRHSFPLGTVRFTTQQFIKCHHSAINDTHSLCCPDPTTFKLAEHVSWLLLTTKNNRPTAPNFTSLQIPLYSQPNKYVMKEWLPCDWTSVSLGVVKRRPGEKMPAKTTHQERLFVK